MTGLDTLNRLRSLVGSYSMELPFRTILNPLPAVSRTTAFPL